MPSNDPIYTVPSDPIAGLETTILFVRNFHKSEPNGVNAYTLKSHDPTYTVPSDPITGLE